MPNRKRHRRMSALPPMEGYRPYGVPGRNRGSVELLFEEYEAIRLADYENLTQEEAAQRMNISRPTFTRLYDKARKNIARAFIESKSIVIRGGDYEIDNHWYRCRNCNQVNYSPDPVDNCQNCHSDDIFSLNKKLPDPEK
ncbi:MAG: DUF134 domain-containing protein [Bacteroidales bacterium]|nr:DUF134 domain-containing protein [Bacteroidales bacterium]MDD5283134.1 DUF134 domain-containing protein [Bacteroidales bacterium]